MGFKEELQQRESVLDLIFVQITRIADALDGLVLLTGDAIHPRAGLPATSTVFSVTGDVQHEEPEKMIEIHGNLIPFRVFREIEARLCSGEKLTPARLCREYSQSPATMRHLLDELAPKDLDVERCRHLARRVTGACIECMDCGAVIGDAGSDLGRAIKDQGTPLLKTIEFEPDPDMPEPTHVYSPGHRPLSDHEVELLRQLAAEQQRNRDLEERLVALNRQFVQGEHRKTMGDDDVDAD